MMDNRSEALMVKYPGPGRIRLFSMAVYNLFVLLALALLFGRATRSEIIISVLGLMGGRRGGKGM